jgi:hypothetical protein
MFIRLIGILAKKYNGTQICTDQGGCMREMQFLADLSAQNSVNLRRSACHCILREDFLQHLKRFDLGESFNMYLVITNKFLQQDTSYTPAEIQLA